jgi:hypothetical protein
VSDATDDAAAPRTSGNSARSFATRFRSPSGRVAVSVVLAVAAGVVVWLLVRGDDESSSRAPTGATAVVTEQQLASLATVVAHPVFWFGPESDETYELRQTPSGKIYVRYLPKGVHVGANKQYLTVATYPFPGAFAAIQLQAARKGAVISRLAGGGLALLDQRYPQSVHIAYPGVDYQVEVYDPRPARAMELVSAGRLVHFGALTASPAVPGVPTAASVADLKALATSLGHPVYWAGPKAGYRYELTRTSNGKVYIRYLPAGVRLGAPRPTYLTVATYPFPKAFAAIKRQAKATGAATVKLAKGGLAVVDAGYPKSVHLAWPGAGYQVEVFDPSPRKARYTVAAGRVVGIG